MTDKEIDELGNKFNKVSDLRRDIRLLERTIEDLDSFFFSFRNCWENDSLLKRVIESIKPPVKREMTVILNDLKERLAKL